MRVVHISNGGFGGAARAAYRLHAGLRRLGHDSCMLVLYPSEGDPSVRRFLPPGGLWNRFRRYFRGRRIVSDYAPYRQSRSADYDMFSDDRSKYRTDLLAQLPPCDVINLHWVADLVDYRTFFAQAARRQPVVWTLHDKNAFTGGCYYANGCAGYVDSCGTCPALGSRHENDLSRQIWQRKRDTFARAPEGNLEFVAASRWLAEEARRSSLLGKFPVTTIHYGLDLEEFAPRDRSFARSVLGVPPDAAVVLFAATAVSQPRKGFRLLAEALAGLTEVDNLLLLSLGEGVAPAIGSVRHRHLGPASNDRLLSVVYSAADVFVIPSLQENLALTALEAMACGTPVVGFDVGGIPDLVRPGVTGLLAPVGDVPALRAAVRQVLVNPTLRAAMSSNCRRLAAEEFALEVQARRYADLYRRMLGTHARPAAVPEPLPEPTPARQGERALPRESFS
jgi:glycosyltransferase involved in cell wall biosynthesis